MSKATVLELATHRQLLDKILHLTRISAPVIFVGGDEGGGKTTLCQQILEQLRQNDPNVRSAYFCCSIESNSNAARKSLLTQIFPKAIFNENDPFEQSITRLAQEPIDIAFILDNGHEASSELLLDLWSMKRHLYQHNPQVSVTIIITALPQWCDIQTAVLREQGVSAAALTLPPLSLKEAYLFVEYMLVDRHGHTGSIFMESVTDSMLQSCYGNPAQLKKLAEKLMHASKEQETLIHPWQKVAVGVVVMAGVALVFSWVLPIIPQKTINHEQTNVIKTTHEPQTLGSALEEGASALVREADQFSKGTEPVASGQVVLDDTVLTDTKTAILEEAQTETAPHNILESQKIDTQPNVKVSEPAAEVETISPEQRILSEEIAPEEDVQSDVSDSVVSALLQKDTNSYTVQLVGLSQQEQARLFVEQHQLQDSSTIYETQRQGQPFFIVIMGEYATQMEAKAALNALPQALKKHKPWTKTFAQIQREVQS